MSATLERFVPAKTEGWRFSGLKELPAPVRGALEKLAGATREVVIGYGEKKTLEESPQTGEGVAFCALRLVVREGASLDFVLKQELASGFYNFNSIEVEAEAGAQVNVTLLNLGEAAYTRQELTAILRGDGAFVNLRSLSMAKGTQEIDQRTLQIHEAPNAKSDLLFKNVLDDGARTIFSGMIRVSPGAQKTDAYQKNRNLILSDEAQANSLPGLEIEADDVRCTHGATCGRLNAEELFYLRARGIGEREAKAMLVEGFCAEVLEGLPEQIAKELGRE